MTTFELIVWAIIGGIVLTSMTAAAAFFYNKETPNVKHLGRDFVLGAAFTGFLYPLIPDSFDDMKTAVSSTGSSISGLSSLPGLSGLSGIADAVMPKLTADPDVQVGPANF